MTRRASMMAGPLVLPSLPPRRLRRTPGRRYWAIAVHVVQRETTREPSPAECVTPVLASPRACREVLNGLTTLAANGHLDTGAHTATRTALGRLVHTLTGDEDW